MTETDQLLMDFLVFLVKEAYLIRDPISYSEVIDRYWETYQ